MMRIRDATLSDAAEIQTIYAPIVAETAISFEEEIPGVDEIARRIAAYRQDYVYPLAEIDGRVAYKPAAEATVYVAEHARGRGVGKALYLVLLPALAKRGYHTVFGAITLPNPGSVALHEAVGFTHIGVFREIGRKFGRYHDVGWWGVILTDEG